LFNISKYILKVIYYLIISKNRYFVKILIILYPKKCDVKIMQLILYVIDKI